MQMDTTPDTIAHAKPPPADVWRYVVILVSPLLISRSPVPQKAKDVGRIGIVEPHDVAARINPRGAGADMAGHINRRELALP